MKWIALAGIVAGGLVMVLGLIQGSLGRSADEKLNGLPLILIGGCIVLIAILALGVLGFMAI
jgi:hypothetical protein